MPLGVAPAKHSHLGVAPAKRSHLGIVPSNRVSTAGGKHQLKHLSKPQAQSPSMAKISASFEKMDMK